MATVFLAEETALARVVAVKLLRPELSDDAFRLRFAREGRAAAAISHPNVVQIYTIGEIAIDPPIPFIIMQYVEGITLDDLLRKKGRMPEWRARRVLRDVASGLAAAHEQGLVHRDVKPANVLIEESTGRAFVSDFGIAAALASRGDSDSLDDAGLIVGTPQYMSPEQSAGDPLTTASDVYSLGVMGYELLTGSLPFSAATPLGWFALHQTMTPARVLDRRQAISTGLSTLVDRCLSKNPRDRPAAADVARAMLLSGEHEILWPPPGLVNLPAIGRAVRRGAGLLFAASMLLVAALMIDHRGIYTTAGWWNAWSSGQIVLESAAGAPSAGELAVWRGFIVGTTAFFVIGLGAFALIALRAARTASLAHSHGWRAETIVDALFDPDGRTGLLLSGSGEFSTLSSSVRDRIRAARRRAGGLIVACGVATTLTWLAWTSPLLLLGRPWTPRGGPPLGIAQAVALVAPPFLCLAAYVGILIIEHKHIGRVFRRPHSGTYSASRFAEGEEVDAWYAELGTPATAVIRPPVRARTNFGAYSLALHALSAAVVLVISITLAANAAAVVLSSRMAADLGADAARVAASVADREAPLLQEIESAMASYAVSFTTTSTIGETASFARSLDALPPYPVDPRLALGARQGGVAPASLAADAIRRAASFSPDSLQLLRSVAEHPRTRRLRDAAAQHRIGLDSAEALLPVVRQALEGNAAAAVVASAAGRHDDAIARILENGIVADAAARSSSAAWSQAGLRLLQSLVVLPLVEIEAARRNADRASRLRQAARRLTEAIDRFGPSWRRGAVGLASDPRDLRILERVIGDSAVPRGFQSAAREASRDGVCLNPREWFAGADAARVSVLGDTSLFPTAFRTRRASGAMARFRYCTQLGAQ